MADPLNESWNNPGDEASFFATESNAMRDIATLPKLSARLRSRVLQAALAAYHRTRRWTQARRAAELVTWCVLVSFVAFPLATMLHPKFVAVQATVQSWSVAVKDLRPTGEPIDLPSTSAWVLRRSPEWTGTIRGTTVSPIERVVSRTQPSRTMAQQLPMESDPLLLNFRRAHDWNAVEAFQALRVRHGRTLNFATATN